MSARMNRLAVTPRLSVWIALTLLSYAFLLGNSLSLPGAAGYGWTRLIDLPRQVRFLEFATIGALTFIVAARRVSWTTLWLIAGCFVFSGLATLSYVRNPLVGPVDFFRLVYMYVLPILVFVIARELPWRPPGLSRVVAFTLLWALASAAVSWIQYLYFGYAPGDDITGLNQDAHVNASLLVIAMLLLFAQGLFLDRRVRILVGLVLGATAVLPSALKVLFMLPFLVGVLLRYYSRGRWPVRWSAIRKRTIAAVAVIATVVAVTVEGFSRIDLVSFGRMPELAERITSAPFSLGPFVAHGLAAEALLQGPSSFLLGLGPFSYSNPISGGQTREGGDLGRFTRSDLLSDAAESGEDARVTLTASLAAEFGVPAFLVLASLYGVIVWKVHQCARSGHRLTRAYGAAVTPGLMLLLVTGVVAYFGSITSLSLSWPLMILAGATARLHRRYRPPVPLATSKVTAVVQQGAGPS